MKALFSTVLVPALILGLSAAEVAVGQPAAEAAQAPAADAEASAPAEGELEIEVRPPEDPDWFDKLLAREAEPLEERLFSSFDGKFEARVAAVIQSAPEITADGDYYFQLGVGTGGPVECWVFPEGHDLAAAHQSISENVFSLIASNHGEIEMRAVFKVDAGIFGTHPFIALDWLYRIKTSQGPVAGQIKHLAAEADGGASVHCLHNEVGYSETFGRTFRGLVGSLKVAEPAPEPYYQEVLLLSLGETRTGVARLKLTLEEDGYTRIDEKLSMLVPLDEQTLVTTESYNIQFSSPEGRLINEVDIELDNGEMTTHLALDPGDDGGWKVSGKLQSKDFESLIEPKSVLSTLGEMLALRRFLATAKPGDETTFFEWISDSPEAFMEIRASFEGKSEDGFETRLDLGPIGLDATLDANGSLKTGTMNMGAVAVGLERIYVDGALSAP